MFTFNEINSNFRTSCIPQLPSVLSVSSVARHSRPADGGRNPQDTDGTEGSFRDYWNPQQR